MAAAAVAPTDASAPIAVESVVEQLSSRPTERMGSPSLPFVFDERVQPGDTIQAIFKRIGIDDEEALRFVMESQEGRAALRQLRAGRSVLAVVSPNRQVLSLNLPVGRDDARYAIERMPEGIRFAGERQAATSTLVEMRSGTIRQTLFGATDTAGVPESVATKLAEIFGTQIDFTSDLRQGDQFSVVYEMVYEQGMPVRNGRILAAEFVNRGKSHTVVLHRDKDGSEAYYTPDGRGLNQAYLRYPLEFTRISSSFGRRLHPIHRSWRSHNGVDFAAPTGTPVKAASDGTVSFVGSQNGYGNIIILRHRDRYATAYAHLNGFARGLRQGQRVRQGDLVGYVGSTGWATGPHLHYEIRVNDVPHDPMQIALPTVYPLEGKELASFKSRTFPLLERLALLDNKKDVASAE